MFKSNNSTSGKSMRALVLRESEWVDDIMKGGGLIYIAKRGRAHKENKYFKGINYDTISLFWKKSNQPNYLNIFLTNYKQLTK